MYLKQYEQNSICNILSFVPLISYLFDPQTIYIYKLSKLLFTNNICFQATKSVDISKCNKNIANIKDPGKFWRNLQKYWL